MAVKTYIITYVKLSGCAIQYDPEFEKGSSTVDGFDEYRFNKRDFPETGADVSFTTQEGYHPKVTIYKDPTVSGGHITDFGTLISNDVGSSFHIPKNLDADDQQYLIIAEAVSDSGINFTYDKTPKFREQETPHAYFDTVKGGPARTETRTYTYEDASVTGTRTRRSIDGSEGIITYYKVHDFMTPEELIGQILGNTVPEEAAITNKDIDDLSDDALFQNYPGTIKFIANLGKSGGYLISLDSAYTYDNNAGISVSFPEPGVYLGYDSILTIAKEVQTSPSPFSKNVNVKAHTEYTSHINGRRKGDYSNAYLVESRDGLVQGVFSEAKECFLEGKPVLYVKRITFRPAYGEFVRLETNVQNRDTGEIIPEALLEEGTSGTAFGSDGTLFSYGRNSSVL